MPAFFWSDLIFDVDGVLVDVRGTYWRSALQTVRHITGKRVTFAFFPWNWDRGDGCIIRLVAILDKSQIAQIYSEIHEAASKENDVSPFGFVSKRR